MTHVIFDIGGVLIDFDFDRLARDLAARTGRSVDAHRLLPLFEPHVVHDVETGRVGSEEFFCRTMAPLLDGLSYDEWVAAWVENYSINQMGWRLLEEARERGMTVSVLSNLSPHNQIAIERKFPHFFRATHRNLYSYELGFHKPDPRIYRAACDILEVDPGRCFFLDDLEANVAGAREAGMRSMRYENDRIPEIRHALGFSSRDAASGTA